MARATKEQFDADVSAEEQDAERQAQDAGLTDSKKVVRWYGQPGVDYREISIVDWKQAGVDLEKGPDGNDRAGDGPTPLGGGPVQTVRWDDANDRVVPLSFLEAFLTEDQIKSYIVRDSRFKIEDK
jgi:hypothetical protein